MKRGGFIGSSDAHSVCWELLPWLANERASPADAARAEAHLRDCEQCREELEAQRRLRDAIRSQDAVVLAPQTSLQKLMQRIDAEADVNGDVAPAPPAAETPSSRPGFLRWSRWLPLAAGVQGIAIAALLGALWWQSQTLLTAPRFTTLTSQTQLARHPVIRVVFAEGVALQDVNGILRSIDAQIVAGPSEAGVYTLGFTNGSSDAPSIEQALTKLRSDHRIVFCESAFARSDPP